MNSYLNRLFLFSHPYHSGQNRDCFFHAMRQTCRDFLKKSEKYRAICEIRGFCLQSLDTFEHLPLIPPVPTLYLKRNDCSVQHPSAVTVTSSGTGGKVSRVGYSLWELLLLGNMAVRMGICHRLFSLKPTHYILLGYQPNRHNKTVISKTAYLSTLYAPAISRRYALRYGKDGYQLDLDALIHRITFLGKAKFPVRIVGFPSYTYFLCKKMMDKGICLSLPKDSEILLGGGWKQFGEEEIPKEELYRTVQKVRGIQSDRIHEFFGAAEHPVLYCTCRNHHFHVPVYANVTIRDTKTLDPLPYGEPGLLNLMTPIHSTLPLLSIMTDDLGVLHPGDTCGCGIKSDYVEILGRVGVTDIKTCSAGASELLKGE